MLCASRCSFKEVNNKENIIWYDLAGGGTALISRSCISAAVYGMRVRRHGKGNAIEYYKSRMSVGSRIL